MSFLRLPTKDPRTIARDIPGISDLLFPQLLPTFVMQINHDAITLPNCKPIDEQVMQRSSTSASMLFEVAYVRAEQMLKNEDLDWEKSINTAVARQSKFFDAKLIDNLTISEKSIIDQTATNLFNSLHYIQASKDINPIMASPKIFGYQWVAEGNGDFSIGKTLIEVKCSSKNFSSSDYRQILMYWLLSMTHSLKSEDCEWKYGILLNPRLNKMIEFKFSELIKLISAGRNKLELLEIFSHIISDYTFKMDF